MTKSELVSNLAKKYPLLTQSDVKAAVDLIMENIFLTLKGGGSVEVRGFGSFQVNQRPARSARNPKTGEAVSVPAKAAPHFRAGKGLRDLINK